MLKGLILYSLSFANHTIWQHNGGTSWQPISGGDVTTVTVDGAGHLFALSNNGIVYRYPGSGTVWQPISGNDVRQLVTAEKGSLFALSTNGIVYRYPGSGGVWTPISGNDVRQLVVDGSGTPFALSSNGIVYRYPGSGSVWTPVSGNDVRQLAVDGSGTPYALSSNGVVYRYPGSGSTWQPVSSNDVQQIVVDAAGTLYSLSFANHTIWQHVSANVWTPICSPDVAAIAVDGAGILYSLSFANHTIWQHNGGASWQPICSPDVADIATDWTGTLYSLSFVNDTVWRHLSANHWAPISGSDVTCLAADETGTLYAVGNNGTVYRYPSSGTVWQPIGANAITASDGSIWFLGTATVDGAGNHAIYRLSSGQFAQLPGSAARLTLNGASVMGQASGGGFSLLDGSPAAMQPGNISMSNGQISIVGFSNAINAVSVTLDVPPTGLYLVDTVPTYTVRLTTTLNGLTLTPIVYQKTFAAEGIHSVAITSGSGEVNSASVPAGLATSGFQVLQINNLPGGTPQTPNTCGPNSAWRVMQAYGGAATYGELINDCSESSWISANKLGTTASTLVDAMDSDQRGFNVPQFSVQTNKDVTDVINLLQQGKPVVAMVRVPGDQSILYGLYTVPQLHWIAVTGYDMRTGTIYYTDTDGKSYPESFNDFDQSFSWWGQGVGEIPYAALNAIGVVEGTLIA